MKTIDDSWNRFPEAKIRMRENGLKAILEGLGEEGFCIGAEPRLTLLEDGVYVEMVLNVGKHGNIVALPLEVFIPAKIPVSKKKKAAEFFTEAGSKEGSFGAFAAEAATELTPEAIQAMVAKAVKSEEKELEAAGVEMTKE